MPRLLSFAAGLALVVVPSVVGCTCSRPSDATPDPLATSASASASASGPHTLIAARAPIVRPHIGPLLKDPDSGHYIPTTPLPPVAPSLIPPTPKRDPDMDLDADDPARDYVRRYVLGSQRYGDKTSCTLYGRSYAKSGQRAVDVSDDPACSGGSTAVRDTFLVDVGGDRLALDTAAGHTPLQLWPDGSNPGGPPNPVREYDDMRTWKTALHTALEDLQLLAVRVQLYGRGTYPVITLAGWRPQFGKSTEASVLDDDAKKFCAATADEPLTFIAGIDRSTAMRIQCPGAKWRWDAF
jgi:hypothetical protein